MEKDLSVSEFINVFEPEELIEGMEVRDDLGDGEIKAKPAAASKSWPLASKKVINTRKQGGIVNGLENHNAKLLKTPNKPSKVLKKEEEISFLFYPMVLPFSHR